GGIRDWSVTGVQTCALPICTLSTLRAHQLRPDSKLRQVLDVEIEGRKLGDWPFAELHRSHARELVDHMLRHQGRAAAGATAILRSEEHTSELQSLTNLVCRL